MIKSGFKVLSAGLGFFNPFELNFAITYRCNSRCRICNIWKKKSENELTLDDIEKFADKIRFMKWIRLTGGEPFLRGDYAKIVRTLDKKIPGLYILTTPTNGLSTDLIFRHVKQVLSFFKKRYIITVSLDGPRNIHDKIRGVKGSWSRAVETYKKLKALEKEHKNFRVFFGYTISPLNLGCFENTLSDLRQVIKEIGIEDIHVNIAQRSEIFYMNDKFCPDRNFWKEAVKEINKILEMRGASLGLMHSIENKYLRLGIKYLKTKKMPITCNIYNLSCFVDPYGDVYPCTIFNMKIGNIKDSDYDLKKILEADAAKKARKAIMNKKCPGCWTPCEAHQMIMSRWGRL